MKKGLFIVGVTVAGYSCMGKSAQMMRKICDKGLAVAVRDGSYAGTSWAIVGGANVNCKEKDGWTPLHWAVSRGNSAIVAILLEHNAAVNVADQDGWTPLHEAVAVGDLGIIKMLLAEGAAINALTRTHETPLDVAFKSSAAAGWSAAVTEVGRLGRRMRGAQNMEDYIRGIARQRAYRKKLLQEREAASIRQAAEEDSFDRYQSVVPTEDEILQELKLMVESSFPPTPDPQVPQDVIFRDMPRVYKELARAQQEEIIKYLKGSGAKRGFEIRKEPQQQAHVGSTALHEAVRVGVLAIVEALVDAGAEINALDAAGNTPLDLASSGSEVARYLIGKGGRSGVQVQQRLRPKL